MSEGAQQIDERTTVSMGLVITLGAALWAIAFFVGGAAVLLSDIRDDVDTLVQSKDVANSERATLRGEVALLAARFSFLCNELNSPACLDLYLPPYARPAPAVPAERSTNHDSQHRP